VSLVLDEHRQFLADEIRLDAFRAALDEIILPSDVVLDLGAGTGILGLLACRAGARRVYAVDDGGMIQVARELCRANGFAGRIVHINGLSTRIDLAEPVDVVVADQIGRFGVEAGIVEYFADARARLLKPGGRLVPSQLTLWVAPVETPEIWERIEFWTTPHAGFDLTPGLSVAMNTGYPLKLRAEQLLGTSAPLITIDLTRDTAGRIRGETAITVARHGALHAIGGWFSARLSPNVTMTNSPLAHRSIGRRNIAFPIGRPISVTPGDRVSVSMSILPAEVQVSWRVEVAGTDGASKGRCSHSTWRGMILCPENLKRTRSDRVPTLSQWGVARRSVLELCDGAHTVADIEAALHARHRDLFSSPAEAARFVAEVLVPYSE
jgi:protein arginine N-methyltransferase 1